MELEQIFKIIEEKKDKMYLMDRCLMWFLYRYKTLKWEIEDYHEMSTYFEQNSSGKIKRMLKETKQMTIEMSFTNVIMELHSEMFIIETGITPDGETFTVRNKEKDLNLRKMLLREVERDKQEFDKIKINRDVIKELTEENEFLRKRVAELERN